MRDAWFREQGLFVGSDVVQAGCKTVIGTRLKRSGMFWTVRGANAILALRYCSTRPKLRGLPGGTDQLLPDLSFHIYVVRP